MQPKGTAPTPEPPHEDASLPSSAEEFSDILTRARGVACRAYAPYSGYRVGAAARADDGRIVVGCNVENAGYGVSLCAECGMVSELIAGGGGRLTRFVCVDGHGSVIVPCGRCRQLLAEHAAPDFLALLPEGPATLEELLPQAFGADHLQEASRHD